MSDGSNSCGVLSFIIGLRKSTGARHLGKKDLI
jgi:hypothetical protein